MNRIFAFSLIFILIAGCSTKTEDKTIDPELFSKIYVELVLQSLKPTDSDTLDPLQMVLDKFEVSHEEFEASIAYFNNNPKLWLEVFTKVAEDLEQRNLDSETKPSKTPQNSEKPQER